MAPGGGVVMVLSGLRRALILALTATVVAACAPGAANNNSTSLKGSTVKLITVWSGSELDSFKAVLQPFEARTGINVEIESTRDIDAILTTRVAAGDPPDLAAAPGPALLTRLGGQRLPQGDSAQPVRPVGLRQLVAGQDQMVLLRDQASLADVWPGPGRQRQQRLRRRQLHRQYSLR